MTKARSKSCEWEERRRDSLLLSLINFKPNLQLPPLTMIRSLLRPLTTRLTPTPRLTSIPFQNPFLTSLFPPSMPSSPFSTTSPILALARKPTKLKLKTHKGAAKRWTAIANGQFKRVRLSSLSRSSCTVRTDRPSE